MGDAMSVQVRGNRYWVENEGNLGRQYTHSGVVDRDGREPIRFISDTPPTCAGLLIWTVAACPSTLQQAPRDALRRRSLFIPVLQF